MNIEIIRYFEFCFTYSYFMLLNDSNILFKSFFLHWKIEKNMYVSSYLRRFIFKGKFRVQHKYWKTTKLSWLTIIICPTQTWSTNNSPCIRPWLVVCLQLIVKQKKIYWKYMFFRKNCIKLKFFWESTNNRKKMPQHISWCAT